MQRTRLGKAMRATAQDRDAAAMMGIDINLTIALTFLIGGALAGAAGTIYGLYNNSAWFFQGFRNGLYGFTAAVMGGIGNIQGAFLGGMLIGIVAAIADFVWDPRWTQAVVFGLLVLDPDLQADRAARRRDRPNVPERDGSMASCTADEPQRLHLKRNGQTPQTVFRNAFLVTSSSSWRCTRCSTSRFGWGKMGAFPTS